MSKFVVISLALGVLLPPASGQSVGPDVTVSSFYASPTNYGSFGGVAAFSMGATCCNIGNLPLDWYNSDDRHPVIAQQLYRLKDGVLTQVGLSWVKHGYSTSPGNNCGGGCNGAGAPFVLGPGCSDPYNPNTNGNQSRLGPRSAVNPVTGAFPFPLPPFTNNQNCAGAAVCTERRLQVQHSDLDPAGNVGARYFGEIQYIAKDDIAAGNGMNNSGHKEMIVSPTGLAAQAYSLFDSGGTFYAEPAIFAWQRFHPTVTITTVDVPGDGRFFVGHHAIPLGGGQFRHVYAVFNYNSDRAGGGFTVDMPPGASISNLAFNDVSYHSGEPYDGTDWNGVVAGSSVTWTTTQTFAQNVNANALRWGTCYTFVFESDQGSPVSWNVDLFKPQCPTPSLASIVLTGNGAANTNLVLDLVGVPNSGLVVGVDGDPGPLNLGSFGILGLGLSPVFFTVADATGLYGPITGNDSTDACGVWTFTYPVGPAGLPSGLLVYIQAIVLDGAAPNGLFHISNQLSLSIP